MNGVLDDERMSDVDALLWNVETLPRNRTTIAALARFDGPLDPAELRARVDRASRVVPRLRQRVAAAPLPIAPPCWSIDPEFRLSFHLRTLPLANGDDARVADAARDLIVQPFDRDRPLWEFTHLTGLADGGDALLLKAHHAISDGVGSIELMVELFDPQDVHASTRAPLPAAPRPPDRTPSPAATICREITAVLAGASSVLDRLIEPNSRPDATAASRALGEAVGSAARLLRSTTEPTVPVGRSDGLDLRFLAVPLDVLRAAGRRVGGTVNDAFVAAVALGVARHFDVPSTAPLRIGVPISTRGVDAGVGNHWAASRIDIVVDGACDPTALTTRVRRAMRRARVDPTHRLLDPLAAVLCRLPAPLSASVFASVGAAFDIAASNVPGSPVPLRLCGREVTSMVPFGPLSGAAVNATLLSHADTAHVGVASDPAAVGDPDRLIDDLLDAFAAVTGAGR